MSRDGDQRRAFVLYAAAMLAGMTLLLVTFHLDYRTTREVLERMLAVGLVGGLPACLAVAAARGRVDDLVVVVAPGLVSLLLVLMATQREEFLEFLQDVWNWWFTCFFLIALALLATLALALRRRRFGLAAVLVAPPVAAAVGLGWRSRLPDFEGSMQEDAWIEWATFYAFVVTAGLALRSAWALWRRAREARLVRVGVPVLLLGGLAMVSLAVAGEEISWGQRLFAFRPPEVFMELNYQQELNVHNFLKDRRLWGIPLDTRYLVAYVALLYGLVAPLARALVVRVHGRRGALGTLAPTPLLAPWFGAVALAEFAYPISFTGEAAELLLGVLLAVDRGTRLRAPVPGRLARRRALRPALVLVPVLLLAAATPPVVERLLYGPAYEVARRTVEEVRLLRDDLAAMEGLGRRLGAKRIVHLRLFSATRRGYLVFGGGSRFLEGRSSPAEDDGDPRRDRRGYFLDPWHNPYWIRYDEDVGMALVYSFGPNRRRDTEFEELSLAEWADAVLGGDDIGLSLVVEDLPDDEDRSFAEPS